MSQIDELIAEHCPNGVQHVAIGDIARTVAGLSGKTKSDFTDGNSRFASYKNIFANPSLNLVSEDFVKVGPGEKQNALRRGDVLITGSSESVEEVGMSAVVTSEPTEPIYVNSFCFIVRFDDPTMFDPDFAKHLFRSLNIRKQIQKCASGVTRINISKPRFLKVMIPVPPLEVQREIVRILDTFSKMEAELEAELEARKQQYDFYRDLAFENASPRDKWVPLGSIGRFERGSSLQKKDLKDDGVPCFHYGQVYTHYGVKTTVTKSFVAGEFAKNKRVLNPGDVFVATTSENEEDLGKAVAWLGEVDAVASSDAYIFRSEFDARYVSYFFSSSHFHTQKNRFITGTKVKRISGGSMEKMLIPNIPLYEQEQIASMLDKFDALVNDLSVGLPAELAARRQQYEYYRDKLLSFKELESSS